MGHFKIFCLSLAILPPASLLHAAEQNEGLLGESSRGHINLSFEVNENIVAGFIKNYQEKPRSEFRSLLTSQLVQHIQERAAVNLPLCVISNGGGYYEITPFEASREEDNALHAANGELLPFYVVLGEAEENSAKYKAATNVCDADSAIQVSIRLRQDFNSQEMGSIRGKVRLLVKSE